jgi:hypothetical protein
VVANPARVRKEDASFDLDDLDELIGAVAAEMHRCNEECRQRQWRIRGFAP